MTSNVDPLGPLSMGRSNTAAVAREVLSRPVVVGLFVCCAAQPYSLQLGPLLIGSYQLILVLIGPFLAVQWLMGRFGKWLAPDLLILVYSFWMLVCLAANGQSNQLIEWGGSQIIDTFFAYLLGRAAIRNRKDFYYFSRILLWVLIFLLPFAFLESTTGRVILITFFDSLPMFEGHNIVVGHHDPRWGLLRAQTGSAHPILYGVLCSMGFSFGILALAYAPSKPSFMKRMMLTSGSYLGVFFSLSSGAFAALGVQILLLLYGWFLRGWRMRWKAMASFIAIFYVLVALISDRPPALTIGRLISFSPSTAFNRYMIWQFGSAEVNRNPIFGMGNFVEWQRAAWMPLSVDNLWLVTAMRFGLVGIGLLMGAIAYVLYKLVRTNLSEDREMSAIRDAIVFTLISLVVAYGTVFAWHIQWSLLLMVLGGSAWIFSPSATTRIHPVPNAAEEGASPESSEQAGLNQPRYTRTQSPVTTPYSSRGRARPTSGQTYSRFQTHTRAKPPKR